jgi:hypothetical protein
MPQSVVLVGSPATAVRDAPAMAVTAAQPVKAATAALEAAAQAAPVALVVAL